MQAHQTLSPCLVGSEVLNLLIIGRGKFRPTFLVEYSKTSVEDSTEAWKTAEDSMRPASHLPAASIARLRAQATRPPIGNDQASVYGVRRAEVWQRWHERWCESRCAPAVFPLNCSCRLNLMPHATSMKRSQNPPNHSFTILLFYNNNNNDLTTI